MMRLERLLTPVEVAELLGVPLATLYGWRYLGRGPRAVKVGRHLRFRPADVEAFLEDLARKEMDRPADEAGPVECL